MAHCLFRPRCVVFPKASPTLQFIRWKSGPGTPLRIQPQAQPPTPSMRVAASRMMERGDIGLLSDTFIMPTGANLPGLFAEPGMRLQLIKHQIKQRLLDIRDMIVFRFSTKNKLRLREPKKVAPSLHRDMYTAFAEGDMDTLRLICGEGLLGSFQKRIMSRGKTRMEWKLHKMLSRPKVVSSKAHHYMGLGLNRRQAIVRIHSVQSLERYTPKGELVPGSDVKREIMEYIVLEKKYDSGKESPWYVWGTTEETTLERLAEQQRRKAEQQRMSFS